MMSRQDNRDQPVCVRCRKTIMREDHLPSKRQPSVGLPNSEI